jgi:hypothetical protein
MKWCSACKRYKPKNEFNKNKTNPDKLGYICKECGKLQNRKWYRKNVTKKILDGRERSLQRLYGVNLERYNQILKEQGGVCAISGLTPEETGKKLAVDHDHETGEIRGLIHCQLNQGLGCFFDDSQLLRKAADYLENSRKQRKNAK